MQILALLLALAAVQDGRGSDRLAQARAKWMAAGVAEYEYTFSVGGLGPPPPFPDIVRCRVRRDDVSVEPVTWKNSPGDPTRPSAVAIAGFFLRYCGVDRLFDVI